MIAYSLSADPRAIPTWPSGEPTPVDDAKAKELEREVVAGFQQ